MFVLLVCLFVSITTRRTGRGKKKSKDIFAKRKLKLFIFKHLKVHVLGSKNSELVLPPEQDPNEVPRPYLKPVSVSQNAEILLEDGRARFTLCSCSRKEPSEGLLLGQFLYDNPRHGVPSRRCIAPWIISTGPDPNRHIHQSCLYALAQPLHC